MKRSSTPVMFVLLLLAAIMMAGIAYFVAAFQRHVTFHQHTRAVSRLLDTLTDRKPDHVPARKWEHTIGWAHTACANVCFLPSHVPLPQMQHFAGALEEKLNGPVNLETMTWIWDELERLSPIGRKYVQRYRPAYLEELNELDKIVPGDSPIDEKSDAYAP